ncbi:hypothetical protein GCK72_026087 [Caenorhabditis remanei]|uniref:Uncharacterized protein n=1 Tax=Caenorhabditis remanei TaxID=31234 RepID=A0A6A5G547_CAERE|nr:hypothetical protein GCK72_026087 [Caenorhabditis remanei]KAF1749619.1 hypothetical protein GCK72_026087 [Caenorhabditis remanei]
MWPKSAGGMTKREQIEKKHTSVENPSTICCQAASGQYYFKICCKISKFELTFSLANWTGTLTKGCHSS